MIDDCVKALNTLKEFCDGQADCNECFLTDSCDDFFNQYPANWIIPEKPECKKDDGGKKDMDENKITLSLADYLILRDKANNFDDLVYNILNEATGTSYGDTGMYFNDTGINTVLKFMAPKDFKEKLEELKAKKKED